MTDRKNDWFATLLNIEDKPEITENVLYANGITPDNTDEIDTAFSETVILAPPTGTRIAKYYTEVYMIKLLNSLVVIVSIIIAILTANKAKHYKKFYK